MVVDVFEVLLARNAWEKRKLGEVADIVGGGTPSTSRPEYWNGEIDWYAPAEIGTQRYVYKSRRQITELGLEKSSAVMLPANKTILFTSRAGIGNAAILTSPATTNQGFQSMIVNSNTDTYFLYSKIPDIKHKAIRVAAGSTFLEISGKSLSKIPIKLPIFEEQVKIGRLFLKIDNLIAATQDKLSFLKKMKMFFLQQIFPTKNHDVPQIRFDGFTDVWSHYKLGSLMRIDKEQEVKKELLTDIQKGFYVLAMRTFSMDGYIDHSKPYWLNHLDNVSDDKFLLPREFAILDADMDANLPKIGRVLLNASSEKYLLAAHVRKIQVKSGNDPIFIYALMRGNSVHERLKLEANGSISKRLLDKNVYKQSILVPNRSEQSKIGRLFFLLETTITLHQQKIQMLKQVKKSCLQNLFI
ncbi:restriction endonuclease subunit S [Lacticaseibacillus paracasei]|uniref:restriction endonuclease subunit S n=1 Tax=Lacticaseibacillus paracasei TaxID=1597 RepID=UPI001F514A96|nr:restriction endonuclease subunit S [Lacticaseibacillus paracasei]MCI0374371.1 restriction endonuclease subunit S [Lacticaseibacillus paracasei]